MQSLLDQVNILIKMKVGDPYRLEHIKLMLKQKRTVYGSDRAYLDHLIHDYIEQVKTQKKLAKIRGEDPYEEDSETMVSEEDIEDEDDVVEMEHIYCWKCGKSIPVNSKFCLDCGSDVKNPEVKEDPVDKIPDKIPGKISGIFPGAVGTIPGLLGATPASWPHGGVNYPLTAKTFYPLIYHLNYPLKLNFTT